VHCVDQIGNDLYELFDWNRGNIGKIIIKITVSTIFSHIVVVTVEFEVIVKFRTALVINLLYDFDFLVVKTA